MKHRAAYHDPPKTLFDTIENIIFDLEELAPVEKEHARDLTVQALLGLLTAVQHEHDKRVAR